MKIVQQADYRIYFDDIRMDPYIKSWSSQCGLNASDAQATVTMYRTKALEQWKGYLTQVRIFVRNVFSNKFSIVFEGEISSRGWQEQRNDVGTLTFTCMGFYHWLDISLPLMIGSEDALDAVTRFKYEAMDINVDGVTKLFESNAQLMMNASPIQSIIDNLFTAIYAGYYSFSDSSFQWANLQKRFKVMADIITQFRTSGFLDAFTFTRTTNIQSFYVYLNQVLTQLMFEFYQDRDGALRVKNPSWADNILKAHILDESIVSVSSGYNNWDNEPSRVLAIGGKTDVARAGDSTLSTGNVLGVPMGLYIGYPGKGKYFSETVEVQMQNFGTTVNNTVTSGGLASLFSQCDKWKGDTSAMKYHWGGGRQSTWDAFVSGGVSDCSSFTMQMFKQFLNISIPGTADTQWDDMTGNTKVDKGSLQPGDLVFFSHPKTGNATHVGIYYQNNQFYNMTSEGKPLKLSDINGNWQQTYYLGAKRYSAISNVSVTGGPPALSGNSTAQQIWNFLTTNCGLNAMGAAGVMGNWQQESSLNPDIKNGHGLAQWTNTGGRLTNMRNFASQNGLSPTSLQAQLGFFKVELDSGKWVTVDKMNSQSSPESAASYFCTYYEAPGNPKLANRQKWARQYYSQFAQGTAGPAGGGTVLPYSDSGSGTTSSSAPTTNKYLGTPYAGSGGYVFTTSVVGQADATQGKNYANTSLTTGPTGLPEVVNAAPKAVDPSQFSTNILKASVPNSANSYKSYIVSRPNGINPNITALAIEAMSSWKEKFNNGNRMGLMGVTSAYALTTGENPSNLYDPKTNIQVGTLLLSTAMKTFNNKYTFALAALYYGTLKNIEDAIQQVNAVDFTKVRTILPADCVKFVDTVVDKYCAAFGGNYLANDPNKLFSSGAMKIDYATNTDVPDYQSSYKPVLTDEERLYKINLQISEQLLIRYDINSTSGNQNSTMNADDLIERYAKYMMQLFRAESHGITVQLATSLPFLRPGFNCWLEPTRRDLVFYVTGVQHTGSYQQGSQTTVTGEFIRDSATYDDIEGNIFVSSSNSSASDFGEVIAKSDMGAIRQQLDKLHSTSDETIGDARTVPYLSKMYSSAIGKTTDYSTDWGGEFTASELDAAIIKLYKSAPDVIVSRKNSLKKIVSDGSSFFTSMLLYTKY